MFNTHLIFLKIYRSVPSYFIWLKYLSWFNYANELIQLNQWTGVTNIGCPNINGTRCLSTGEQILAINQMKTENYAIDFIALCILFAGWRTLTFLVLLAKSYRK